MVSREKKEQITEGYVKDLYKITKFYSIKSDIKTELWCYQDGIYVQKGECLIKEFVRDKLKEAYTTNFANQVIEKIVADNFIEAEIFFNINNKGKIALLNGILDLKTKKLTNFSHKIIFFNKFNIVYDENKKPNKFLSFLKGVITDKNNVNVIQELFGDLLYTEYKFQKCFMFLGNGRNGKGVLGEIIKEFLGVENICSVYPETLEDPNSFTLSYFHRKLCNLALDINDSAFKKIGVLKSLSGGDPITGQRKFLEPIVFKNYAKLIFGANQLPITYDTKSSFWERWILIEFPYTFTEQKVIDKCEDEKKKKSLKVKDPFLTEKLMTKNELSGILNWAIEGFERLMKNKEYSYGLTPEEVKILWIRKSDSFRAYFMEFLEVDYDFKTIKKDLRRSYIKYCKDNKLRVASDKMISMVMREEGVIDDRYRDSLVDEYVWDGIKFKSDKGGFKDEIGFSKIKSSIKENNYSNVKEEGQVNFNVEEIKVITEDII